MKAYKYARLKGMPLMPTYADISAGRSIARQKAGNDHTDHFARHGSLNSLTPTDRQAFLQAKSWYAWLATLVAHWPADTQKRVVKGKRSQNASLPNWKRRAAVDRGAREPA